MLRLSATFKLSHFCLRCSPSACLAGAAARALLSGAFFHSRLPVRFPLPHSPAPSVSLPSLFASGGALYLSLALGVSIAQSVFIGNIANYNGGALYADVIGNCHFMDTVWTDQYSDSQGGAIAVNTAVESVNNLET